MLGTLSGRGLSLAFFSLFLCARSFAQVAPATSLPSPQAPPPPPPAPSPFVENGLAGGGAQTPFGGVSYGAVDAATVRVFAVGNVRAENVRGRSQIRTVAIPETGHGSGVVVDGRGVIVTAAHVVRGAHHVAVRLSGADAQIVPAVVVHQDDALDFALLLVGVDRPLTSVLPLPEAAPVLAVRQTVDAIGFPLDPTRERPQSTRGIVSAALDDGRVQLGISVNPGNSGGPLIDDRENLVGIVVARGDVSQGVQGIGLAVPVAPIKAAFDGSSRAFAQAYQALRANPSARQSAEVVDALVRLGGLEILAEAADVADGVAAPQRLAHFDAIAEQTRDASLLTLLAAFFWDASLVILERSGGAATPAMMPPGDARTVATRAQERARELARRAHAMDPTVAQRSPFVGYLANVSSPGAPGVPETFVSGPSAPTPERRVRRGWFPTIAAGYQSDVANAISNGFQLALHAPILLTGNRDSSVRFAFGVGFGFSFTVHDEDGYYDDGWDSFDVYALVGPTVRFGRRIGLVVQAAWAPGARAGCPYCDEYESDWEPTWLSFRFSIGPSFGRFHVAFTARIADALEEPSAYYGEYRMLVLQMGATGGVTF